MKKLFIGIATLVILPAFAQANSVVDSYFTTMQLVVDTANQLATPCQESLPVGSSKISTSQCRSFMQAYNIVLDESDRLNQMMHDAHQTLPPNDMRLDHLQHSIKQLNTVMDKVEPRLKETTVS